MLVSPEQVIEHLGPLIEDGRKSRIENVVNNRTYSVVPVVEGLYDRGNVAAVCRTSEALGVGAVHIIKPETEHYKKSRRSSAGAEKWVEVHRWDTTKDCLTAIKQAGYKILVTSLESSKPLSDFDWSEPTAVVFGNEKDGVSDVALEMADACIRIPMVGFVESYNISVANALVMYHAYTDRISRGEHGDMTDEEKQILTATFYLRHKWTHQKVLADMISTAEEKTATIQPGAALEGQSEQQSD